MKKSYLYKKIVAHWPSTLCLLIVLLIPFLQEPEDKNENEILSLGWLKNTDKKLAALILDKKNFYLCSDTKHFFEFYFSVSGNIYSPPSTGEQQTEISTEQLACEKEAVASFIEEL